MGTGGVRKEVWVIGEEREGWEEESMVMELGGKEGEEVREEGETYAHWMHTTATCFLSLNTTLQSGLCEGGGRREKGEREGGGERRGRERKGGERGGGRERKGEERG